MGEGAALTRDEIFSLVQTAIQETLTNNRIGAQFQAPRPIDEPIPPAPPDEPQLDAGPITTWATLRDQPATPADAARIHETVRRFDRASGGHAAYWLTRALTCVALEEAPLTISYASGILRRMQVQGDWSTEELHRRANEQRIDTAATVAPPAGAQAAPAKPDRVPRGKAKKPASAPAAAAAAPTVPAQAEAQAGHPVIAVWRRFAGASVALTPARVQQLIAQVTDLAVWEVVLTNWQAQYAARPGGPNWAHVDGLLERYTREVASGRATAGAAKPIPAMILDEHPEPRDPQERSRWFKQYQAAQGPAAKQDVLRQFLQTYPPSQDLIDRLQIPPYHTED